jgi:nucleotide-binding universal stress UspA family protein
MKRFKSILYVSEPSVTQDAVMARAVSLAENNQANLMVVDVVPAIMAGIRMPPGGPISADLQDAVQTERRMALDSLIGPFKQRVNIETKLLMGKTFLEVIRTVLHQDHDLVVKPAENPDWVERLFGSDDMHLLRKCPCPVWLMKAEEKADYDCIVAAIDFDPAEPESAVADLNRTIVELSSSLAISDFASLHLVHAWNAPAEGLLRTWSDNPGAVLSSYVKSERQSHQAGMDIVRQGLFERIGQDAYDYLKPHFHLAQGSPAEVVPRLTQQLGADVVVMGTVARTGIPGLIIGNTAEAILDQLKCSVLAVKPTGFVSPVKLET